MDWQALKETAWKWTQWAALFLLLQTSLLYLWACFIAGKPIGPVEYIRFQYHVIQYHPQRTAAVPVAALAGVSEIIPRGHSLIQPNTASKTAGPRYKLPLPEETSTNQKAELMSGRLSNAIVMAVLDAGTPVRVQSYFVDGTARVVEIVRDGSHQPAEGFTQTKYLNIPEE